MKKTMIFFVFFISAFLLLSSNAYASIRMPMYKTCEECIMADGDKGDYYWRYCEDGDLEENIKNGWCETKFDGFLNTRSCNQHFRGCGDTGGFIYTDCIVDYCPGMEVDLEAIFETCESCLADGDHIWRYCRNSYGGPIVGWCERSTPILFARDTCNALHTPCADHTECFREAGECSAIMKASAAPEIPESYVDESERRGTTTSTTTTIIETTTSTTTETTAETTTTIPTDWEDLGCGVECGTASSFVYEGKCYNDRQCKRKLDPAGAILYKCDYDTSCACSVDTPGYATVRDADETSKWFVSCGETISGCVRGTDTVWYKIDDTADTEEVTITLSHSGYRCNKNDLYVYHSYYETLGGNELGSSTGDKEVDTWTGSSEKDSDLIVKIRGDQTSNHNCQWEMKVVCGEAGTTATTTETTTTISTEETQTKEFELVSGYNMVVFPVEVTQEQLEDEGCDLDWWIKGDLNWDEDRYSDTDKFFTVVKGSPKNNLERMTSHVMEPLTAYLISEIGDGCTFDLEYGAEEKLEIVPGYNMIGVPIEISQDDERLSDCDFDWWIKGDLNWDEDRYSDTDRFFSIVQGSPKNTLERMTSSTMEPWIGYLVSEIGDGCSISLEDMWPY